MMNVCQESQNFVINMLINLEPTPATDQFSPQFLHKGLENFMTFDLGVGFYWSMGLYSHQYGALNEWPRMQGIHVPIIGPAIVQQSG